MNEEQEAREPTGRDEATSTQAGPPREQGAEPRTQGNARPDLDAREARIRETRKPAGPPLGEEPGEPLDDGSAGSRSARQPDDVDPVDPAPASEEGA